MLISLIGYMGCGKSHISKALCAKTGFSLVDLDELITEISKKNIEDLFSKIGELGFRKLEKETLESLLSKDFQKTVLSLGGGTPCYYENIETINQKSRSIYLRAKPATLVERLKKEKQKRPLIKNIADESLEMFISKHLFDRNPFYHRAHIILDVDGKNPEEISDEIIDRTKLTNFL